MKISVVPALSTDVQLHIGGPIRRGGRYPGDTVDGFFQQLTAVVMGSCVRRNDGRQATWLRVSAAYSGSTSQITRLRPLRLAA
jgi:hypothetical protein